MAMTGWLESCNELSGVTIGTDRGPRHFSTYKQSIRACIISTQLSSTFHYRTAETGQDFSCNLILQPTDY